MPSIMVKEKADRHAVTRMYALHRTYTLNISPSICGFNKCAAATLELADTLVY